MEWTVCYFRMLIPYGISIINSFFSLHGIAGDTKRVYIYPNLCINTERRVTEFIIRRTGINAMARQQFGLQHMFVVVTCVSIAIFLLLANHQHLWTDSEGLSLSHSWVLIVAIVYLLIWSAATFLTAYLYVDIANRSVKVGLGVFVLMSICGLLYNFGAGVWACLN